MGLYEEGFEKFESYFKKDNLCIIILWLGLLFSDSFGFYLFYC